MKLLIDMNLPPAWCEVLERRGWKAVHWSTVGDPRATDHAIMAWAGVKGYVVLTHDLDFSAILAATRAGGPSVVQVRTQDVTPGHLGTHLVEVLNTHRDALEAGAIITVDEARARVRILPLSR